MPSQLDLAKHRLFDKDALNVKDVKLFPGGSRDITPEQMAEQLNKALAQIEAGDYEVVEDFND